MTPSRLLNSQRKRLARSEGLTEHAVLQSLRCANLVATTSVGCSVNLDKLHRALPETQYDPEIYFALIFRPKAAKLSCLVNTSGKVVLSGAKSLEDCRVGTDELVATLCSQGFNARTDIIEIRNLVFTGKIGHSIRLSQVRLLADSEFEIEYEPEQFPGAILRSKRTSATILLFQSGSFNVVGCTSEDDVRTAVARMVARLAARGLI